MQPNAVKVGVCVIVWALPKQESTITNKAKSIKSQNGFIILKPTLMKLPNKLHYQTWCGKSCGFPAHVDRKTEFCVCVCEGSQLACFNLLQEDYTTPGLSLMFFCQRASRSSSSTGARAGGHSDGEDVSLLLSLFLAHCSPASRLTGVWTGLPH